MKNLKRLLIGFISLIAIIVIARKIWTTIEYYNEVSIGNEYAHNIITYLQEKNKLPDEGDRDTLKELNPYKSVDKRRRPEYRIWSGNNFTLSFVQGFDWPYLTYDSETKTWEMKY